MIRTDLTKKQRWEIAGKLAEDRLPIINQKLSEVHPQKSFYTVFGKRTIDIVISVTALAVFFPLNLILGIITFLDVGFPLFFKQERAGKNGNLFYIIKFRNMCIAYDERGELLPPERRVTKFGRFMRSSSLDEL